MPLCTQVYKSVYWRVVRPEKLVGGGGGGGVGGLPAMD